MNAATGPDCLAPVSVVVPCFRCAGTIGRAIDSVAAQSLRPVEVFLVDDFSNDDDATASALLKVREKYRGTLNIKLIKLDRNGGPGAARNAAWDQATQPYIAFLDADDSWHPAKLDLQYRWMEVHREAGFCGHDVSILTDCMVPIATPAELPAVRISKYDLLFSNRFPTRSVMVRRNLPFRFSPEQRYSEDYRLWLTLLFNGVEGFVMPLVLAYSFKDEFGGHGLSGDMAAMQRGEIGNYRYLLKDGKISIAWFLAAAFFSSMKYWRRLLLVWQNRQPMGRAGQK